MAGRLTDRVAIVTGAASGIGRATAELLADEGASVVLADVDEQGAAVTEQIKSRGPAVFVQADVTDPAAASAITSAAVQAFGRVDILVNNAGIGLWGTVDTMEPEAWDAVLAVNVRGTYLVSKYAIPELRKTKGVVVNIGSGAGIVGVRNSAAYCAAKGAVIALTRAMAVDYASEGLRVNCVVPGVVDTPFNDAVLRQQADPTGVLEAQKRAHPLGRLATAEEVARAVLFLVSGDSSFTTASLLMVDGGLTAA